MKNSFRVATALASLCLITGRIHAQESPAPDSIVQITAEAEGLTQADPATLPLIASCWWTVYPGSRPIPMPCPPLDLSVPIFEMSSGVYLVDELGGTSGSVEMQGNAVADLIEQVQEREYERSMARAFGLDIPMPGDGGGDDGGTNTFLGSGYPMPDYGTNLWIAQTAVITNYLTGIGSNTLADIQYEIQSRTNLAQTDWQSEGFIWGSELTNWTPLSVSQLGRTNLFIRLRSWADDGSGLPIWWQLQYFGTNGVDPYGDPDGDGWNNLQEFQNGTSPTAFDTPPAPQVSGTLSADYQGTVSWLPSPGPVTGYTVERDDSSGISTSSTVSPTTLSFQDDLSVYYDIDYLASYGPDQSYTTYAVTAQYAGGNSSPGTVILPNESSPQPFPTTLDASLVLGPNGRLFFVLHGIPNDLQAVRIYRGEAGLPAITGFADYFSGVPSTTQTNGYFEIAAANVTNGICELPDGQTAPYFQENFAVQIICSNGVSSDWTSFFYNAASQPFVDLRRQMKDNLSFLLRAASPHQPFQFYIPLTPGQKAIYSWPTNCVYSGFSGDVLEPADDNAIFRNFVFDSNNLDDDGNLVTGASLDDSLHPEPAIFITNLPTYFFDLSDFMTGANTNVPPSWLSTTQSRWLMFDDFSEFYISDSSGTNHLAGKKNYYGLPYLSAEVTFTNNGQLYWETLYDGDPYPTNFNYNAYYETAQPGYQLTNYYFANAGVDPQPELSPFSATNITRTMFLGVGSSLTVAGYEKFAVTNAYPGTYAYLGQYFDEAYKMDTNGAVTADTTGVLSPYGNFFATEAGNVALVTVPDIDTDQCGTNIVHCFGLQVDKNHDGMMDLSYSGPDATSQDSPDEIWINNDYDRGHTVDGSDFEQDDLGPVDIARLPAYQQVPDCDYVDASGQPAIPSTRDLEDYFRLWTPGVATAMAAAPTNYTVRLTLSGDGQIRIFRAFESNGGTNYLFDEPTASNQVAGSASLYVGLLTSSSPLTLSNRTNEHYIFCGAHTGSAQVSLQILDGNQSAVAHSLACLQINDIKQMYERWTVGENPNVAPEMVPTNEVDNLNFQYSPAQGTNTPYILFVHGWNMETWEKDRYAESAYKRLYWQGYRGMFGSFRWPTDHDFGGIGDSWNNPITDPRNFDNSEFTAWQSSTGLTNLLLKLSAEHPGQVYLMAHSMGNVVAGEALRKLGTPVVNTYVAMQGAIASHAYDPTTATRALVTLGINEDSGTPNRYAEYYTNGAPCYFSGSVGAGTYVNFYNTNDFALSASLWQFNQNLKPDGGSLPFPGYFYDSSSGFYRINGSTTTYLNFPTNTYEIFAYGDEARCYALGAQANVGGEFTGSQVELNAAPYGFLNSHKYHSGEFRSDNAQRAVFWNTVLVQMQLK